MIVNNWYVALESAALGADPVPVRMLGCDFALFRDSAGAARCLSAVCCHRGADLGRGACIGGELRCPYHGWTFAGDGLCTKMPPLGDEVRPPPRARVDAYPVEERYGLVWVFLGDLPPAERPSVPNFLPMYGDESRWRMIRLHREWDASWARVHENLLDASHLPLVHSFGKHLPARTKVWPAESTAWGGRIVQRYPAKAGTKPAPGVTPRAEATITLDFSIIGLIHCNSQQLASGYDQVIWNCLTPIDAFRTRNFGLHFRNARMEPAHDDESRRMLEYGLDEDAGVVGRLRPPLRPATPAGELWMATDNMERLYRDQAMAFAARLGEIDSRRLEDLARDRVLVIPSPGRREAPGNYVHAAVPLLGPAGSPAD